MSFLALSRAARGDPQPEDWPGPIDPEIQEGRRIWMRLLVLLALFIGLMLVGFISFVLMLLGVLPARPFIEGMALFLLVYIAIEVARPRR